MSEPTQNHRNDESANQKPNKRLRVRLEDFRHFSLPFISDYVRHGFGKECDHIPGMGDATIKTRFPFAATAFFRHDYTVIVASSPRAGAT